MSYVPRQLRQLRTNALRVQASADDGSQSWNEVYLGSLKQALEQLLREGISESDLRQMVSEIPHDEVVADIAPSVRARLRKATPGLIGELRGGDERIARSLSSVWGAGDNQYRAASYLAYELGDKVMRSRTNSNILWALLGLHARSLKTAAEVRLLAMNGFAAGAEARGRSLHEFAVVGCVIGDASEEIAMRYLAFADVERCGDAESYQENAGALGREPFSESQMTTWKSARDSVIKTYGGGMANSNGWALPLFPARATNPKARVTFAELEALAGMEHFRVIYRLGNHHVHAGPRAAELNMQQLPTGNVITPGATVYADLIDICDTALSRLLLNTATLVRVAVQLSDEPDVGLIIGLHALRNLHLDAATAYEQGWQKAVNIGWISDDEEPLTSVEAATP
jgi:hypothetical protein